MAQTENPIYSLSGLTQEQELALVRALKLITHRKIGIHNERNGKVPTVYYIGVGRSGSASLLRGFPDHQVAQWHGTRYFEQLYGTDLLTRHGLNVCQLAAFAGQTHGFKPLIIECLREPISQAISLLFQRMHAGRVTLPDDLDPPQQMTFLFQWLEDYGYPFEFFSKEWSKLFGVKVWKVFEPAQRYWSGDLSEARLLLLRFDDIPERPHIFNELGYRYVEPHENNSRQRDLGTLYADFKNQFELPRERVLKAYAQPAFRSFYTRTEVRDMVVKYSPREPV